MQERTLSIIKPDAVEANKIGAILSMIENAGLKVVAGELRTLTREEAEEFYIEHKGHAFQPPLVDFMTSGPCFVSVLEGEDAVAQYRKLMGATKPEQRAEGTIRAVFGDPEVVRRNAVHGSDSLESAAREIEFFFSADLINVPSAGKRQPRP